MLFHIRNQFLKVSVSDRGAELMSILSSDGTEYLWQGDPTYWADRAPNIFPYVARLTGGSYTYGGKTSDKIDFKTKAVKRDKEGHYIMIKGSIQEDITIINIHAPNTEAPQNVRQMLTSMKGEINNNTIIVGDFNTPLTPIDRSTKQKINKETQTLKDDSV